MKYHFLIVGGNEKQKRYETRKAGAGEARSLRRRCGLEVVCIAFFPEAGNRSWAAPARAARATRFNPRKRDSTVSNASLRHPKAGLQVQAVGAALKRKTEPPTQPTKSSRSKHTPRRLSLRERIARNEAFEALRLMRTKGWSLAHASAEAGITPRSVIRHVGKALSKGDNGRYSAKPSDRLTRHLSFLTPDGNITLQVQGSRKASQIGEYFEAVRRYFATGDTEALSKFENKSLRVGKQSYPFITDIELLERLYSAGVFSFENLYALGA
jgi:hypothetical protein